jgi:hypothetical protein
MEFRSNETRKAFELFNKYFNPKNYYLKNNSNYYPSPKEIETRLIEEKFTKELCTDLINYFGDYNYENLETKEISGLELLKLIKENRRTILPNPREIISCLDESDLDYFEGGLI